MELNPEELYKPRIKSGVRIDGIAAESVPKGGTAKIIQVGFLHSRQPSFKSVLGNLLPLFNFINDSSSINKLLVTIGPDHTAKIYQSFPITLKVRSKRDVKKGELVTENDIYDISQLKFKDSLCEIPIAVGDKVFFLFRKDWQFGCYFNFSGIKDIDKLKSDIGHCYQSLFYYDLYKFIEEKDNFNHLVEDGRFPFIRLIGNYLDKIVLYYEEGRKHDFHIDDLISNFNKQHIESFTNYWRKNPLFKDKKEILTAGIGSFLQNDKAGFINCLHTLYPQIEGIVGVDYYNIYGKKPSFNQLMTHIKDKASEKHSANSVGFPKEFYKYLADSVFQNFNLETGNLDLSRHTTCHGYANVDEFNKAKALQAILTLDQIHYYL